jgi:hypothetical protein
VVVENQRRDKMKIVCSGSAFLALILSAQMLQAQMPDSGMSKEPGAKGMMMTMKMPEMATMDSMNSRLDTLVGRMNRAKGDAKVTAMAQVINELVTQRKVMQKHMQMMRSQDGVRGRGQIKMDKRVDSAHSDTLTGKPRVNAEADTAGPGEHHPKQ